MLNYIEYLNRHLNIPVKMVIFVVVVFLIVQIVGEILEFKGKIVPEFLKIRKYFQRKKEERKEITKTLISVKQLLNDISQHYNDDNIQKRNNWMQWVNDKIGIYSKSIMDIKELQTNVIIALDKCTKMTEEIFVQNSRDRIINFAVKVGDKNSIVSREEFNRIFKVYKEYERFIHEHGLTNGEIDIAMQIIEDSYEQHIINHTFIEDICGYK